MARGEAADGPGTGGFRPNLEFQMANYEFEERDFFRQRSPPLASSSRLSTEAAEPLSVSLDVKDLPFLQYPGT
jgi:hypothetical protein